MIYQRQTGAIVNWTNEDLRHTAEWSRESYEIVVAAGPSVEAQCKEYISNNGKLKIGACMSTRAGDLSCKHIVHTAFPRAE